MLYLGIYYTVFFKLIKFYSSSVVSDILALLKIVSLYPIDVPFETNKLFALLSAHKLWIILDKELTKEWRIFYLKPVKEY